MARTLPRVLFGLAIVVTVRATSASAFEAVTFPPPFVEIHADDAGLDAAARHLFEMPGLKQVALARELTADDGSIPALSVMEQPLPWSLSFSPDFVDGLKRGAVAGGATDVTAVAMSLRGVSTIHMNETGKSGAHDESYTERTGNGAVVVTLHCGSEQQQRLSPVLLEMAQTIPGTQSDAYRTVCKLALAALVIGVVAMALRVARRRRRAVSDTRRTTKAQ